MFPSHAKACWKPVCWCTLCAVALTTLDAHSCCGQSRCAVTFVACRQATNAAAPGTIGQPKVQGHLLHALQQLGCYQTMHSAASAGPQTEHAHLTGKPLCDVAVGTSHRAGLCAAASWQQPFLVQFRVVKRRRLQRPSTRLLGGPASGKGMQTVLLGWLLPGWLQRAASTLASSLPSGCCSPACRRFPCPVSANGVRPQPVGYQGMAALLSSAELQTCDSGPTWPLAGQNEASTRVSRAGCSLTGHRGGRRGGLLTGSERLVSPGRVVHSWRRQREHGQNKPWSGSAADAGPAGSCLDPEGWQAAEPACPAPRSSLSLAMHRVLEHPGCYRHLLQLVSWSGAGQARHQCMPGRTVSLSVHWSVEQQACCILLTVRCWLTAGVGAEGSSSRPSSSSVPGTAAGEAALSYWQGLRAAAGDAHHVKSSWVPDIVHSAAAKRKAAHSRSGDVAKPRHTAGPLTWAVLSRQ